VDARNLSSQQGAQLIAMRESPNTQTSACALQDCFLPPVAIPTGHELGERVSPERRLEFEDVLSRNLPRFQRVAMH
jgi:hypothetical protein